MPDIIRLLPDAVANQIAAGEVVQRPASAVKELLENAVDAGATDIKLLIKDAGKTLIQVIDNGCGMTETDARLSFERHATSKIRKAEELFAIKTKGFRGEALASIAAISQVEMKSRMRENELGTRLLVSGNKVECQEPTATACGTSIAVRNLFFNTPARRNFLKSDPIEMKHIIEEFERVALVHADIGFTVSHNGTELFNLRASQLRQRIVNLMGGKFNERLVPVKEETAIVRVTGFIGKPEYAKKTRGEQYLFVNDRFIRNNFLHHAIASAYRDLVGNQAYPAYFIYLDLDPARIDVNIHPTKTEVKFLEERSIYSILHAAVRNSLGKYNISPSLDFDQEQIFNIPPVDQKAEISAPSTKDYDFNPFASAPAGKPSGMRSAGNASFPKDWTELYQITEEREVQQRNFDQEESTPFETSAARPVIQVQNRYLITTIKSGFVVIDQHRAHERILYERNLDTLHHQQKSSQQQLFAQTVELSATDCALLMDLKDDLTKIGFTLDTFGGNTIVVNGVPSEALQLDIKSVIEQILEQYKNAVGDFQIDHTERLARSTAHSLAIKPGKRLSQTEMIDLIDTLFGCRQAQSSPNGKPVFLNFSTDDLLQKFKSV